MSQYIGVVRGDGREEYVEESPRLTKSKESAARFNTGMDARVAAEAFTRHVLADGEGNYPRLYPWITEVDAEEV